MPAAAAITMAATALCGCMVWSSIARLIRSQLNACKGSEASGQGWIKQTTFGPACSAGCLAQHHRQPSAAAGCINPTEQRPLASAHHSVRAPTHQWDAAAGCHGQEAARLFHACSPDFASDSEKHACSMGPSSGKPCHWHSLVIPEAPLSSLICSHSPVAAGRSQDDMLACASIWTYSLLEVYTAQPSRSARVQAG